MASLSLNSLPLAGRFVFGLIVCLLIGGAYYLIFHSDLEDRVKRERQQTALLDDELSTQREVQASYFADRDELAMRRQKQGELNKILPVEAESSTFLSAIQTVANISGVDLKAWTPMDEVPQTFFAKVPMRLQLSGRFLQIAKFVNEIGKQDRIINVENLELTEPAVQGEDVVLKTTCLATTFHLLKPASKDAAGQSAAAPK